MICCKSFQQFKPCTFPTAGADMDLPCGSPCLLLAVNPSFFLPLLGIVVPRITFQAHASTVRMPYPDRRAGMCVPMNGERLQAKGVDSSISLFLSRPCPRTTTGALLHWGNCTKKYKLFCTWQSDWIRDLIQMCRFLKLAFWKCFFLILHMHTTFYDYISFPSVTNYWELLT